jgi:ADP-heptose:LPS heptosyltransferase
VRILGISLLRLGDLILQKPLIEGLRKKHPQSEIHMLINKQFAPVEFLFAGLVDRFIYFDRELLQKSCGEKEFNILWGVRNLKNLVDELNRVEYDDVYNFTHNRLTAHIAGLIKARRVVGIYSAAGKFYGLDNPWIQFFNNYFGRSEAAGFHYTEILAKSLEIPLRPASAKSLFRPGKKKILLQPLTSDAKKNWSLARFQELARRLAAETAYEVLVLGAPFEAEVLAPHFAPGQLKVCSLQEAAAELKQAALLITGDTSIKHLAALFEVPILEISLGSAQPLQVGAFSNESYILESRLACGPCPHSVPCSQPRHACAEQMSVVAVLEAAHIALGLDRKSWERYAQNHVALNVYRTEIRHIVGWTVEGLSVATKNNLDEILQRKMMIVEELDRRHHAQSKGVSDEQRTRKLSDRGVEAP